MVSANTFLQGYVCLVHAIILSLYFLWYVILVIFQNIVVYGKSQCAGHMTFIYVFTLTFITRLFSQTLF